MSAKTKGSLWIWKNCLYPTVVEVTDPLPNYVGEIGAQVAHAVQHPRSPGPGGSRGVRDIDADPFSRT